MEKIVYSRKLYLGDFESIVFEAIGEHEDLNTARLIAVKKVLELFKLEIIRIYGAKQDTNGSAWSRVEAEYQGVELELANLKQE